MKFFSYLGKVLLRGKDEKLSKKLEFAGIDKDVFEWSGQKLFTGLLLVFLTLFLSYRSFSWYYAVGLTVIVAFSFYFIVSGWVSLNIEQRNQFIETNLPDLLLIMASNVRSGLSTDEALILSARPEFGFLSKSIKNAGREISAGKPVREALTEVKQRFSSSVLNQTIDLIVEGIESGGELATLLESISDDIKTTALIKKEIRSIIFVYAAFITIAVILIAPVLYAVSVQLSTILANLSQSMSMEFMSRQAVAVQLKPTMLSETFLFNFSLINLVIISVLGSLMIGLINKGDEKYGLRYMPIVLAIALFVFYVARWALSSFFGAIRVL